jgi:hypothetical protein
MTDQEIKNLVAGIAKETMRETDLILKENALQMKETERMIQEVHAAQKETARSLDKLCKKVGGMDDNIGHHAEQFFQNVFEEKLEFGGVKYDEMIPNLKHKSKSGEVEFDIVLVNGDSIALIEVKHRIHPSFVIDIAENKIEKFRKYFREFKNYKAYLGIAAFSYNDEVLDQAGKYGVGIIRQAGKGIEMKTKNLKAY